MAGDEIDAPVCAPSRWGVDVARAGDAACQFGDHPLVAAPEAAQAVPVRTVPLRPALREPPELVTVRADVPRLCDQLDLGKNGVLLHHLEEGACLPLLVAPHEHRCQVETEPVHVHVGHPVPQAVHHESHRAAVEHVEAVAGAREVHVVAGIVRHEPVVDGVVDAAERQGRPELVALAGVVVDHVEDHLDPGPVQCLHHRLELGDLVPAAGGGIPDVRSQEADRVVAPVVGEALLEERPVADELMHWQQLDCRDPEGCEVIEHRVAGESEVGPAQMLGDARMEPGQAANMRLVDDRTVPGDVRRAIVAPGEGLVDDDRLRHRTGGVPVVASKVCLRMADLVAEQLVTPADRARDRLRIRVDQELGAVEAMSFSRRPRPVHAVAVKGSRAHVGQVGVPDVVRGLRHGDVDGLGGALVGEDAQLDGPRML